MKVPPAASHRAGGAVMMGPVVAPSEVTFVSDGLELAGHLRVPSQTTGPGPGLIFTGPLTGVKEQVTGHYADALAQRGYVTLAFDHRGFGASEGRPRHHEDPAGKLADLVTLSAGWPPNPRSMPAASAAWASASAEATQCASPPSTPGSGRW
jgi:dienelactone hydrolase